MADPNKLLACIIGYDKDNISDKTIRKIETYTSMECFYPEIIATKAHCCACFCAWVRAIEEYHKAKKCLRP